MSEIKQKKNSVHILKVFASILNSVKQQEQNDVLVTSLHSDLDKKFLCGLGCTFFSSTLSMYLHETMNAIKPPSILRI